MTDNRSFIIEEKLKSMLSLNTSNSSIESTLNVFDKTKKADPSFDSNRPPGAYPHDNPLKNAPFVNTIESDQRNKKKRHRSKKKESQNKINMNCDTAKDTDSPSKQTSSFQNNFTQDKSSAGNSGTVNQFTQLNIMVRENAKLSPNIANSHSAFKELHIDNEAQNINKTKLNSNDSIIIKDSNDYNKYKKNAASNFEKIEKTAIISGQVPLFGVDRKKESVAGLTVNDQVPLFGVVLKKESVAGLTENKIEDNIQVSVTSTHAKILTDEEKIEEKLEEQGMFLLKKRNPRFPKAKYFCRVCSYHLDTVQLCFKHSDEATHKHHLNAKKERLVIEGIKELTPEHEQALTDCLEGLYLRIYPSSQQINLRINAFEEIKKIIQSFGAKAELYGSTKMFFASVNSDINISIATATPSTVLINLEKYFKSDKSGKFTHVVTDFSNKVPKIYLTMSLHLPIVLTIHNEAATDIASLLRVYSLLDTRAIKIIMIFKHWAKICRVDLQEEGMLSSYGFMLMSIYFLQQRKVLPVLHHILSEDDIKHIKKGGSPDLIRISSSMISSNRDSLGKLWIELLKFYTIEFDVEEKLISITNLELVTKASHNLSNKRIAIEDPANPKRNVARSLCHSQANDYIITLLVETYKYFGLKQPNLQYFFDEKHLCNIEPPRPLCNICLKTGHTKSSCKEDILPTMPPLPPLNNCLLRKINDCLQLMYYEHEPGESEMKMKNKLLVELDLFIKKSYPMSKLVLFGSQCNGFAFKNSDMDISLILTKRIQSEDEKGRLFHEEVNKNPEEVDQIKVIEDLTRQLKKNNNFYDVFAITSAKVPIIKFKHFYLRIEGDISLFNTLAQYNTRMLYTYSRIDGRVKPLGFALKILAKTCDICDASKGALSSYAYTLMVIFFLQQCSIPVLPVLQQVKTSVAKPEDIVDGWNAWFFEDLSTLHWSIKNKKSIAELWVEMLDFYATKFNINDHVIAIRQIEPLTKFEKMWIGPGIAIEDPFNLDHNLGSGLSGRMNIYILKVIRSARNHFGIYTDRMMNTNRPIMEYFFNAELLCNHTLPPNDRGCRICRKIGHFSHECPRNRSAKEMTSVTSKGKRRSNSEALHTHVVNNEEMHEPLSERKGTFETPSSTDHLPETGRVDNDKSQKASSVEKEEILNLKEKHDLSRNKAKNKPMKNTDVTADNSLMNVSQPTQVTHWSTMSNKKDVVRPQNDNISNNGKANSPRFLDNQQAYIEKLMTTMPNNYKPNVYINTHFQQQARPDMQFNHQQFNYYNKFQWPPGFHPPLVRSPSGLLRNPNEVSVKNVYEATKRQHNIQPENKINMMPNDTNMRLQNSKPNMQISSAQPMMLIRPNSFGPQQMASPLLPPHFFTHQ